MGGRLPRPTWLAATLLIAACAAPEPGGTAPKAAEPHPDRRILVDYGGREFRVDIRYVDIIGESVIAVRAGRGDADPAEWRRMTVVPGTELPAEAPFADDAYRRVAIEIADALRREPPICVDGRNMRLATDPRDDARTLYRAARQAWVVFAFCPEAAEAEPEVAG